jgi:glucosamine-6-phosphate deaminase
VHVPDGSLDGIEHAGAEYDAKIRAAGGVDLQLLGIGTDGHIGFNEPGSSFSSRTRVKTLTEQTRKDNARFFDFLDQVPMHCITQGLGTILEARHLVLLAYGEGKAQAVADAVEGPLSAFVPGSAIQLHPHTTVVVDEAAASRLKLADYYRYTFANKPAWQGI